MAQYDEAELMLDVLDRIGDHGFPNWASEAAALIRTQAARIAELEARAEAEARGYARAMEDAAAVADTCRRENGPMSKKGFPEDYRRGLEAAGQAIATAIRALAQKEAGE